MKNNIIFFNTCKWLYAGCLLRHPSGSKLDGNQEKNVKCEMYVCGVAVKLLLLDSDFQPHRCPHVKTIARSIPPAWYITFIIVAK